MLRSENINFGILRSPSALKITPIGCERDIEKFASTDTAAAVAESDAAITGHNADAALYETQLQDVAAGNVAANELIATVKELRTRRLAITVRAVELTERRNELRRRLQIEFDERRASLLAKVREAEAVAERKALEIFPFGSLGGETSRAEIIAQLTRAEREAIRWQPMTLFSTHHDDRDLALMKRSYGLALLDAAGVTGALSLPTTMTLPV